MEDDIFKIACVTCKHRKSWNNDCKGDQYCLLPGIPDKLKKGYSYTMNFQYLNWESSYKPPEQIELDPELFEI